MPEPEDDEPTDIYHKKPINDEKDKSDRDDSLAASDTEDTNLKEKEAAWRDDDDCNYT